MRPDLRARLERLDGYRIERELGGGGMSRVFLAEEPALGRRVAIKVLESARGGVDAERFRREVLLSARLQHPHIVPLLAAGETDGLLYYVMPFVEGQSLRARLRAQGPLPLSEAVRLLRGVAAALDYAHARGVVHRDIKPDNVGVAGGIAVVLDFGVSKALAASTAVPADGITGAGLVIGTPRYMAPEQIAGDPDIDGRADLYAFGVLAYELIAGEPPFVSPDPAKLLRAHLAETPVPLGAHRQGLPPGLAALVMRCLEKDRERRPAGAAELLDQLEATATPSDLRIPALREGAARAWAGAGGALVLAAGYLLVAAALIGGVRWLVLEGLLGRRYLVFGVVAAVLGLPIVLATGLVLRLGQVERQPARAR